MLRKFNLVPIILNYILFWALFKSLNIVVIKGFFLLARGEWMGLLGHDLVDVKYCN